MDIKSVLAGTLGTDALEVPFGGHLLLETPLLNKGTAFTREERRSLGLLGLLPPSEESLDEQAARAFEAYGGKRTDLLGGTSTCVNFRIRTRPCSTGSCSTIWPR